MADTDKIFALLVSVFLLEVLIYNILKPNLYKIPGDIFIDRWGFRIYIPFVSTLIISVILTLLLNYFKI